MIFVTVIYIYTVLKKNIYSILYIYYTWPDGIFSPSERSIFSGPQIDRNRVQTMFSGDLLFYPFGGVYIIVHGDSNRRPIGFGQVIWSEIHALRLWGV